MFGMEQVQGYATLRPREQKFVQALFEGATQREAMQRAGYNGSSQNGADVTAHKLAKSGRIQAVMNQAWLKSGNSIDTTLRQTAEVQARAFDEWQKGTSAANREQAFTEWLKASTLLASIHGKLSLKVEGEFTHKHLVISPEMENKLIDARRRTLIHLGEGGTNGCAA